MKKILIIGIGAGDPEHLTVQAISALNRTNVFFVMDKGPAKAALASYRHEICRRYITNDTYRIVEVASLERDSDPTDYHGCVEDLNERKKAVFTDLIAREVADGECGAFLVWGDPSLYDSTLRIVEAIASDGHHPFDYEVIPGITSLQALAAKSRTTLNRIGQSVTITTGRRLSQGWPADADSVAVMLDAGDTYKQFAGQNVQIYWGAYIGMPNEIRVAGKLADVASDIERRRSDARRANGWIMDCYLMRKDDAER
ncbi:precorrin-6A synthase (deacetylating) [Reyranella sp. CPCC 100927]|uniref:precorrin-6A synthase (deacetylating) n=1 Tax=Reyranella sp. CPCC 100927 TaxID=2599616 RepID=UPI0011B4D6E3|nr:precorrin-6A synthase (deacetylating) [Reyranella sp. CPCC 100927]TWT10911.1 precorrin-6A synthase (deacetylating) [Reyranella sp. CPCC 100927]